MLSVRLEPRALTLLAFAQIALAQLGCSSGDQQASVEELEHTEGAATICSSRVVGRQSDGAPRIDREFYYFDRINTRLEQYPELAQASGLTRVASCAEARQFSKTYLEYTEQHPALDDAIPDQGYWDWLEQGVTEAVTAPDADDVAKIWQGSAATPPDLEAGIVLLELENGLSCSASFISDRWLLTAASCILFKDPESRSITKNVKMWQMAPDGSARLMGGRIPTTWYPYEKYFGSANYANNVALVSFYPRPDERFYEARDVALPLARLEFASGAKVEPWGWGQFEESPDRPGTLLGPPLDTSGARMAFQLTGSSHREVVKEEFYELPASANTPRICDGDEGGPLLEDVTQPGDARRRRIIHGVAADFGGTHCATPGTFQQFARVDTRDKLTWIEAVLQHRDNGHNARGFECDRILRGKNDDLSHMQCWERYCTTETRADDCIYSSDNCAYLFGTQQQQRCWRERL